MNLYIISNVLWDATRGMCVIAAESMSHCEEIYVKKFEHCEMWSGGEIIDAQQDFRKNASRKRRRIFLMAFTVKRCSDRDKLLYQSWEFLPNDDHTRMLAGIQDLIIPKVDEEYYAAIDF